MAFCYSHSAVPCSAIQEVSTANGEKKRDPQPDNMQRVRETGTLNPNCVVSIKSLPLRAQGTMLKRRQKGCKSRDGGHQGNKVF